MISQNILKTITLLDFAYAIAEMLSEQFDSDFCEKTAVLSMADALKKNCVSALRKYPISEISDKHTNQVISRAQRLITQGWGESGQEFNVFTTFVLAQLDDMLEIPRRKNGQPAKSGWIKDRELRNALQDVYDAVLALQLHFDPDYSDDESTERGLKGVKVFKS